MKGKQVSLTPALALGVQPGELEEEGFSLGFKSVAGLDEVGRGPLAGPVMAAAVIFPRGFIHPEITDSKLLTAREPLRRRWASAFFASSRAVSRHTVI